MESILNRYYDPSTDSFISVDPMVQQTDQPYVFVNDNPLNETDPLGRFGFDPCTESKGRSACLKKAAAAEAAAATDLINAVKSVATHPGDVLTAVAIGACIVGSGGLCAGLTVAALGARVAQRSEEGVPLNSPSNYLDAGITAASFGLLSGPVDIGEGAVEDSRSVSSILRVHGSLPSIFGWTTGEVTHRDIP